MSFGPTVKGDVLQNYGDTQAAVTVARATLALSVIVSYPLPFYACRGGDVTAFLGVRALDLPRSRWIAFSLLFLSITVAVSLATNDVSVVLAFKGSVLASFIVYIFPAAFYMRILQQQRGAPLFSKQNAGP